MSIIIKLEDYLRYEDKLKPFVKNVLSNVRVVVLDSTAIDVVKGLGIKYAFTSTYHVTSVPIPTPPTPQYAGFEWNLTPNRLFYLEVDPLIREFSGYLAMDAYDKPVCVIDTGINDDHRVFSDNMNLIEKLSVVGDDGSDVINHGTPVASIISTLVPYAKIVSIKVFRGAECSTDDLLAGIDLAIQKGCGCINMSLGGYPTKEEIDLVEPVLKQLRDQGIIAVVASGNESQITQVAYPARSPNVISVGSVTLLMMRAYYSNVDPSAEKPDFTAFGDNILVASANDNEKYESKSGTSFATPVVTSLAYYMLYFYDVAKAYNMNIPLKVCNTYVDPRKDAFTAVYEALKTMALQNNPFGKWNTLVGNGVVSFRKINIFDVWGYSFSAVKPPLILPPLTLPKIADLFPKYVEKIFEKFLREKNYVTIVNTIQQYPDLLDLLLKLKPEIIKEVIVVQPQVINILPPEKQQLLLSYVSIQEIENLILNAQQYVTMYDINTKCDIVPYAIDTNVYVDAEKTLKYDSRGACIAKVEISSSEPIDVVINDTLSYTNVTNVVDVVASADMVWRFKFKPVSRPAWVSLYVWFIGIYDLICRT